MDTLKTLNSPPRSALLRYLLNQEYRFTIPKSRIQLTERQEEERNEEEEQRQLQNAMGFTQMQ